MVFSELITDLKQFLCKHRYNYMGRINATFIIKKDTYDVPINCYECIFCGKRKVVKYDNFYYNPVLLETLKMWENKETELDFNDESEKEKLERIYKRS